MKKYIFIACVLTVLLLTGGCGRSQPDADMNGLIFSVNENLILVVSDIEDVNIPYDEWFEAGKRAIWFSIDNKTKIEYTDGKRASISDLKEGQAVEVWTDGATMKSYPEQARSRKIVIITEAE